MVDPQHVPILFVVFSRPDLTGRVFDRIREIKPRKLFIAADGPRKNRPDDAELCRLTREVTRNVDWECEVHRLERDENLGCRMAVSGAINWFFDHVEEGIILEDDCLPDPSFFQFCAELLAKYRDDDRVAHIGGCNFTGNKSIPEGQSSYYFSRFPHIWGWATWKRVWQQYDVDIRDWNPKDNNLTSLFNRSTVREQLTKWFDTVKAKEIDTWDYQVVHLLCMQGSLSIGPRLNLVENIGFDHRATHTIDLDYIAPPTSAMMFPLRDPREVRPDLEADAYTEEFVHHIPRNQFRAAIGHIRSIAKRVRRELNALSRRSV